MDAQDPQSQDSLALSTALPSGSAGTAGDGETARPALTGEQTRSFRGRLWTGQLPEPEAVRDLIQAGTPAAVAPILAARGVQPDTAGSYLMPTWQALMPDPFGFRDMTAAVDRLERAVRAGEQVVVWGDYDVDGATSTAVLVRYLRAVGLDPWIHIPDRVSEGYGPNAAGLAGYARDGAGLVCVLDAGTTAFEPLAAARAAGLDVVVVDHHAAEEALPEAVAVVNPNRLDESGDYGHLCAAGVTFLVVVALNARLRSSGYLAETGKGLDLKTLLDLVALGTVADVVPLTGLNRAYVQRGLGMMAKRGNPGLAALCEIGGVRGELSAYHLGFVIGPRINAGGRIGQADVGARLLASDDPAECQNLAQQLDAWNRERQEIERACVNQAIDDLEADPAARAGQSLMVLGSDWHEGVIGIVAGRVKERYDKPVFVFSEVGEGLAKGSARSMPGFDLGACVIEARRQGLLVKGGGHAMAAGATLEVDRMAEFRAFVDARVAESAYAQTGAVARVDAVIDGDQVTLGLAEALDVMQPFGTGNPRPRLLIRNVQIHEATILNDKEGNPSHLRVNFQGHHGQRTKAMAFRMAGTPMAEQVQAAVGGRLDLLGTIQVNEWKGRRSAEVMLDDARPATAGGLAPPAETA